MSGKMRARALLGEFCAPSVCLLSLRRDTHSHTYIKTDTQAGRGELCVHTTLHNTTQHNTARRETKTAPDSLEGWTAAEQRAHRPAWRDSSPP